MGRKENLGESFLSQVHNFHPPKSGGKGWREKCSHSTFTQILVLELKKKKKKPREREHWRKRKERMRAAPTSAGTFLNEEEKENKRRGIEIRTTYVEEKKKKKKCMDEMKAEKGEII